jgi:glucoamylase
VDIPTAGMQEGMILFTLCWPGEGGPDRWLGRNVEVVVAP